MHAVTRRVLIAPPLTSAVNDRSSNEETHRYMHTGRQTDRHMHTHTHKHKHTQMCVYIQTHRFIGSYI